MPFFYNYNIKYGKCQDLNLLLSVFSNTVLFQWGYNNNGLNGQWVTIILPITYIVTIAIFTETISTSSNLAEDSTNSVTDITSANFSMRIWGGFIDKYWLSIGY